VWSDCLIAPRERVPGDELVYDPPQRQRETPQACQTLLDREQPALERGARVGEGGVLELGHVVLKRGRDRFVSVDDGIEERMDHPCGVGRRRVPGRPFEPALRFLDRPGRSVVQHEDDPVGYEARELLRLDGCTVRDQLVEHEEEVRVVRFELRSLARVERVLDGKVVKAEVSSETFERAGCEPRYVRLGPHQRLRVRASSDDPMGVGELLPPPV